MQDVDSKWEVSEDDVIAYCVNNSVSSDQVIARLKSMALDLYHSFLNANDGEDVVIELNRTVTGENSQVDPIFGVRVLYETDKKRRISFRKNPKKFAVYVRVMEIIHDTLRSRSIISKRGVFYQDVELFVDQNKVNVAIEDIASFLEVPRISLGVVACPKGLVAGPIQLVDVEGLLTDCSRNVQQIPLHIDKIHVAKCRAIAVLVVEKDTVFMRLVQSSIVKEVILVTGKGIPDVSTRQFVKLLEDTFDIPIVGLFDPDAYGIFIMQLYKYGSKSSAYDGISLASTRMSWLGVRPSEILSLPPERCTQMTERDIALIKRLLREDFLPSTWKEELNVMLKNNLKAEIEALLNCGSNDLIDIYLPKKFMMHDWI